MKTRTGLLIFATLSLTFWLISAKSVGSTDSPKTEDTGNQINKTNTTSKKQTTEKADNNQGEKFSDEQIDTFLDVEDFSILRIGRKCGSAHVVIDGKCIKLQSQFLVKPAPNDF